MKKITLLITALALLMLAAPYAALAQTPTCEFEYTVQEGDWLSKIADKYFGDILAYPAVVEANNASADDNYTNIDNADLIEPGWLLCIPSDGDAATSPTPAPEGLARDDLANAAYKGIYDEPITLTDGKYEGEPFVEGAAARPTVVLVEPKYAETVYGDVTGDGNDDAVTFLAENSGGSGVFTYMAVVVNQDGQPVNIATTNLGDRIQINATTIENKQIIVDMVQAGPNDPLCCPTEHVIKTFEVQGDQLVEVSSQVVEDGSATSGQSLAGTDWRLTSINGEAALTEAPVTAKFGEDGSLSGTDGCNTYSMTYEADGNNISINAIGPSALMACPEPIMTQSTAYKEALAAAATYQIDGDTLTLMDAEGNAVATFTEMKPATLAASNWRVIAYNNGKQAVVSVIIGAELTANFGADGRLTGSSGCNNYSASYEAGDTNISIGPAAVTQKFCAEPEGLMEQEAQYLAALQTAATYKIELNRMEMRSAEGSLVANFELMEEAAVTGTVNYLQRIALPDDAVITAQIQDTSKADAPAEVIGEQVIPTEGKQVPIPFEVTYNPNDIEDNHTYTLSVRITDGAGKLLFINTTSTPVITRGSPTSDIEVIVDPV